MKALRVLWRGIAAVAVIIGHIAVPVATSTFKGINMPAALQWRLLLSNRLLHVLGIRVEVQTPVPTICPAIFVCNHRSYLDPIVVFKDIKALPVAKAEVGAWPLIGYGAKATGVIFVERENKESRGATVANMAKCVKDGFSVLMYPEGTTHTDPTTMMFRRGTFTLAAKEGFPIVPVAVDYLDLRDAWIGDDEFIPHFMRCFSKKETHIKVRYGQPIWSDNAEELIATAQGWINENLLAIRAEFDQRNPQPA